MNQRELFPPDLHLVGVETTHHFVGKGYVKTYMIPKGVIIGQHKHERDHYSALLVGSAMLMREGDIHCMRALDCTLIRAGVEHSIQALEDSLWACIWDNPMGIMDPEKFDEEVTS